MRLPHYKPVTLFLGCFSLFSLFVTLAFGDENAAVKFVENCLQEITTEGVFLNSFQGGYYVTPSPFLASAGFGVPIYRDKTEFVYPDVATLESELSHFLENTNKYCLSSSPTGGNEGIDVTIARITAVKLGEGQITVSADYTWRLPGGGELVRESLTSRVPSDYRRYHAAMLDLIEVQKENPDVIVFSELVTVAKKHRMKISYGEAPEDFRTIVYALQDESYVHSSGQHYKFLFALRYPW